MAKTRSDWYPDGRHNRLDLARRWISVFSEFTDRDENTKPMEKWAAWGIPHEVLNALEAAYRAASEALDAVIVSGARAGPLSAAVHEAFDTLENLSRDIKRRYIFSPPLSAADFDSLGVKPKDTTRTVSPPPRHTLSAKLSNPDLHIVQLAIVPGVESNESVSAFSYNIRMGILSPDGVIPQRTPTAPYYMTKMPAIPEDLPGQFNRRRKKELFIFTASDAGKQAYFCLCCQNSKGETGPWSPMLTAIIT